MMMMELVTDSTVQVHVNKKECYSSRDIMRRHYAEIWVLHQREAWLWQPQRLICIMIESHHPQKVLIRQHPSNCRNQVLLAIFDPEVLKILIQPWRFNKIWQIVVPVDRQPSICEIWNIETSLKRPTRQWKRITQCTSFEKSIKSIKTILKPHWQKSMPYFVNNKVPRRYLLNPVRTNIWTIRSLAKLLPFPVSSTLIRWRVTMNPTTNRMRPVFRQWPTQHLWN